MTASIILSTPVTDAALLAHSVPETDHPPWSGTTSYAVGDRVIRPTTHRRYECVIAGANTTPPEQSTPTRWIDLGPTNRWAAFDRKVGSYTSSAGNLSFTLAPGVRTGALALLDVQATSATVVAQLGPEFSRASSATYIDGGVLKYADVDEPRFQDGVLLVEGQATNLLRWSEAFDNPFWTKNRSTVMPNAAVAPDGTMTADKLISNLGQTRSVCRQLSVVVQQWQIIYVFAKRGEWDRVALGVSNSTTLWGGILFNLSTGSIETSVSYGGVSVDSPEIDLVGDGWYRCSVRLASSQGSHPFVLPFNRDEDFVNTSITGDGTSGVFIWGAEVKDGRSSYIPTTTAPVTRAADLGSLPIYTRTVAMTQPVNPIVDYYTYWQAEFTSRTALVLTDLPREYSALQITVTLAGQNVQLGTCVLGKVFELGRAQRGMSLDIADYSIKNTDAYGVTDFLEGDYSKRLDAAIVCPIARVDAVATQLAKLRATPVVVVGAPSIESSIVYGLPKTWKLLLSYTDSAICNLIVEGLT